MPGGTKNLGIVKAIFAGSSAPENTVVIWYDTVNFIHKYFNGTSWVTLTGGGGGSLPTINNVGDSISSLDGLTWTAQGYLVDNAAALSVNWNNRSLANSNGDTVVDWSVYRLVDAIGQDSLSWGDSARNLISETGVVALDWSSRLLVDSFSMDSLSWEQRYLYDATEVVAQDWANRTLFDTVGQSALSYGSRLLSNSSGHYVADWGTEFNLQPLNGTPVSYATNKASRRLKLNAVTWDGVAAGNLYWDIFHEVSLAANKTWLSWYGTNGNLAMRLEDEGALFVDSIAFGATEESLYYDNAQNTLRSGVNTIVQQLVGTVFTKTSDTTVASTVVETNILGTGIGNLSIGADNLKVGKTIAIKVSGFHSSALGPNLTVRVRLGGTLVASGTLTCGNGTNDGFDIRAEITCRSIGMAGTVSCKGTYEEEHTSGGLIGIVKTTNTTIDTTANQALTVTVQWSAASASNTITAQIATVTIKN